MTADHTQWLARAATDRTGMLDAAHREAAAIRDARAAQVAAAENALRVALAEVNRLRDRGERHHDWRPALVLIEEGRGRDLAPCGTYGAYQRHVRRAEDVDPECEAAKVKRNREREKDRAPRRPRMRAEARA